MTHSEETYILRCCDRMMNEVKQIKAEVHENNIMLSQLMSVVNHYLANHNKENNEDFGRNVLANLISSAIDIRRFRR